MPVTITCPACNSKLKAPDNLIGKAVKCPTCSKPVLVKAPGAAAPPAPAPVVKKPVRPPEPVIEEEPIDEMEPAEDELDEPGPAKKGGRAADASLGGPSTDKERSTAMWIYLLPFLLACCGGIGSFVSLFMWISKRKESPFIDYHGKNWLNLAINCSVLTIVLSILSGIGHGVGGAINTYVGYGLGGLFDLLILIELMYFLVMMIISGFKAKGGVWYQPKMAFRLLK